MLRQFSTRRIIVFFLIDWFGTLLLLNAAGLLHSALLLQAPWGTVWTGQPSGWADSGAFITTRDSLPLVVTLMVAFIWPVLFSVFSIYDDAIVVSTNTSQTPAVWRFNACNGRCFSIKKSECA